MDPASRSIAVVEDNPADAEMLRVALEEAGIPVNIVVLENGRAALEYLMGETGGSGNPCDLVLLDLNLPLMSGFEVLEQIRRMESLRGLPVVIMSGSKNPEEIDRCYELGANSYVSKPSHLTEIFTTASQLIGYWFGCAKLPARRGAASS